MHTYPGAHIYIYTHTHIFMYLCIYTIRAYKYMSPPAPPITRPLRMYAALARRRRLHTCVRLPVCLSLSPSLSLSTSEFSAPSLLGRATHVGATPWLPAKEARLRAAKESRELYKGRAARAPGGVAAAGFWDVGAHRCPSQVLGKPPSAAC